jgi:hypothetical protein
MGRGSIERIGLDFISFSDHAGRIAHSEVRSMLFKRRVLWSIAGLLGVLAGLHIFEILDFIPYDDSDTIAFSAAFVIMAIFLIATRPKKSVLALHEPKAAEAR